MKREGQASLGFPRSRPSPFRNTGRFDEINYGIRGSTVIPVGLKLYLERFQRTLNGLFTISTILYSLPLRRKTLVRSA
jgi:hypothetical protein